MAVARFVVNHGNVHFGRGRSQSDRFVEDFGIFSKPRMLINVFRETRPSGWPPVILRKGAARANYGVEQASRGDAFAEIEPVGNYSRDAECFASGRMM